jgi:hypothetical protein
MKDINVFIARANFFAALAIFMAMLAIVLSLTGCTARDQSAKTIATYEISADGIKKINYESTKEQQGLTFDLQEESGKVKSVKIRADRSTTNDESVTASMAVQLKMLELLQTLTGLAAKAAMTGGS